MVLPSAETLDRTSEVGVVITRGISKSDVTVSDVGGFSGYTDGVLMGS